MRVLGAMNRLAAIVIASVVLVSCAAPPSSATPEPSPSSVPVITPAPPSEPGQLRGQVAYVAGADPQIFLLDLATGESRQLTRLGPEDAELEANGPMRAVLSCGFGPSGLAWSPDGSLLAFTYGGCDTVVYVVDVDGHARRIGDGRTPAWSPDGRELAFGPNIPYSPCGAACMEVPADAEWELFVVDMSDGGKPRQLTSDGTTFGAGSPRYSPDGSLIAFTGPLPQPQQDAALFAATYVIRSDGSRQQLVGRGAWPLGWLPDGRLMIVDETTAKVSAVDLESTDSELLAGGTHVEAVAPDGSQLLLSASDPTTGANRVQLASFEGDALAVLRGFAPTWAPDGRAFLVADPEQSAIVVVDRDGSVIGAYPVAFLGGDYRARWRPGS